MKNLGVILVGMFVVYLILNGDILKFSQMATEKM